MRLRRGVPLRLLLGQEAVTSLSRGDKAGTRAFHKATRRDELRLLNLHGLYHERRRVSSTECAVAFSSDT